MEEGECKGDGASERRVDTSLLRFADDPAVFASSFFWMIQ
jgi:hypothetical protein